MVPKKLIDLYRYFLIYGWTAEKTLSVSATLRHTFEYYGPDEATEFIEIYKIKR